MKFREIIFGQDKCIEEGNSSYLGMIYLFLTQFSDVGFQKRFLLDKNHLETSLNSIDLVKDGDSVKICIVGDMDDPEASYDVYSIDLLLKLIDQWEQIRARKIQEFYIIDDGKDIFITEYFPNKCIVLKKSDINYDPINSNDEELLLLVKFFLIPSLFDLMYENFIVKLRTKETRDIKEVVFEDPWKKEKEFLRVNVSTVTFIQENQLEEALLTTYLNGWPLIRLLEEWKALMIKKPDVIYFVLENARYYFREIPSEYCGT